MTIAQEQKADLMLLGCSGHSQFHKFFLGSTALDVARLCKVPLWLEPINSSSQPTTLSTMLLATDASKAVKGAENLAKKLSQHIKRTLAITVISDLKDSERELTDMKSHFRHLAESIEGLETEAVKGYPTFTIIEASVKANADLIIIGKRGRNQLSEFLLGSTAEAIARGSDCPVLIVPSDYR
ncbi:MAG: universal stress protein [Halomonas sp.]|nr:universal stress protein [Halomonas sp.]